MKTGYNFRCREIKNSYPCGLADFPLPIQNIGMSYNIISLCGKEEIIATFEGFEGEPYVIFNYKNKKLKFHKSEFDEVEERILLIDSKLFEEKIK